VLFAIDCRSASAPPVQPAKAPAALEGAIDGAGRLLRQAVVTRAFPGGVLVVGDERGPLRTIPFGRLTYDSDSPRVTEATVYDLASLTKVVATTAAAMVLVDEDSLDLNATVSSYLPAFVGESKATVTVRQLLSHSAGLPAWAPLYREARGKPAIVSRIASMDLEYAPGTRSLYGDLAMIMMAEIIEQAAKEPFEMYVARRVFVPLGMHDSRFRPEAQLKGSIAPTEQDTWRGRLLRGEVDDENAYAMGGVAGHAGLFSTAPDVARFAQVMLDEGKNGTGQWISAATVRNFTRVSHVSGSSRALGWDTPGTDPYLGRGWSASSYGHTGFTGTLLWIDPELDLFVVLLTNRVYPSRENDAFSEVRREVCEQLIVGARSGRANRDDG
jgi:CubicO group peptidase (beta-lactamase class C family)